jgi:hypothetical protein
VPEEYFFSTIIGAVEKQTPNLNLKEKFLEFYITNGCKMERYHTILVETYIDKLFKMKKQDSLYESSLVEGNLKQYLDKFDKLIKTSNYYHRTHVLEKIKGSWLMEQEIYLYSKLDLHSEALVKLINVGLQQKDFEIVDKYCLEMIETKPDILADLFKMLSENYTGNYNAIKNAKSDNEKKIFENLAEIYKKEILDILKKYNDFAYMDPFVVLDEIPVDWFINDEALYRYFTQILKDMTHFSNKYKISRNLSETALIYKEKDLIEAKDRSITISGETYCELCRKKIGTGMFCVYPNMKIYHPKCAQNPNICPVTRIDFTKKQIL